MILLTRFNSGERIAINPDLIERIEETPDTVVTMTNGNRYVVGESIGDITAKIRVFRASLLARAAEMTGHPSADRTARLRVVRPASDGEPSRPTTLDTGAVEP